MGSDHAHHGPIYSSDTLSSLIVLKSRLSNRAQLFLRPQDGDSEQPYLESGSAYECILAVLPLSD